MQTADGRLLFTRREGKRADIWSADSDGKNARRLTSEGRSNLTPVVTADGRYIVFISNRSGTFRVWRMDADGRNPIQLTEETAETSEFNPTLTAEGHVIFNHNYIGEKHPTDILRVPIDGKSATTVMRDQNRSVFLPQISPDGKHLLFTSYDVNTITRTLNVAAFDGNAVGDVESVATYSLIGNVKWMPDGKYLSYVNTEGIQNLWQMLPNGTQQKPITDFRSGRIFNYAWARDGKTLFIVRGIVSSDLVLIRDADSSPTP